jgi:hypothetical protein
MEIPYSEFPWAQGFFEHPLRDENNPGLVEESPFVSDEIPCPIAQLFKAAAAERGDSSPSFYIARQERQEIRKTAVSTVAEEMLTAARGHLAAGASPFGATAHAFLDHWFEARPAADEDHVLAMRQMADEIGRRGFGF